MDIGQMLEWFHWRIDPQLANSPAVPRIAIALIVVIAISWLAHFYKARRRREIEIREQLEQWARVGEQRRFFEDLRSRPVAGLRAESPVASDQKDAPDVDRFGVAAGSSVSDLLVILNSEEAAPRASPSASGPAPRKAASR